MIPCNRSLVQLGVNAGSLVDKCDGEMHELLLFKGKCIRPGLRPRRARNAEDTLMVGARKAKARLPSANFVQDKVGSSRGLRRSFAGQPDFGSCPLSL